MKKLLMFVLLLFWAVPVFAQVDTAWVRTYNGPGNGEDESRAIAIDGSCNVYVTGESEGSGNNADYATIKYYPNGDTAWVRRYNGPWNDYDWANAIAVDGFGNVHVTGTSGGTGSHRDYATIKYYPDGDTAWLRRYNGPENDEEVANAIAVDGFGNVYVTGGSYGSGINWDYATIKYDANGNELWVRRYNGPVNNCDYAHAIAVDGSGNVYVTGESPGSGTIWDYATVKYDANGNELWVRRYNGPGNGDDRANAIAVDGSGNIYVTGYSYGSGTSFDCATIKYDANGNELWVRRYNGPGNGNDYAKAIAVDGSGNVYVTGSGTIKYDSAGNLLWIGSWGGVDITLDSCNNVCVTGGWDDYVTIKYVQTCGDLGFRPDPDGWQFGNTDTNMWPQSWWQQQFNYCQYPYPWLWCFLCKPSDFPDWPLFVSAFGENQCYYDPPPGLVIYKPRAVLRWFALRGGWSGSCFGFAISSFLFFDEYLNISSQFPGYTQVYSVPINDQSRLMQNKYYIYQFGKAQQQYINANYNSTTPNQTLQASKQMFNASTRDDRILVLCSNHGSGGHAVNPYRCEIDSVNPEITYLYVYDNNFPNDDSKRVSINTSTNTWSYDGLPGWGGTKHLFLMDPVSNYTTNPVMPISIPPRERWISEKGRTTSEYVELYLSSTDTALFELPAGSIGHIGDSLFTTLSDGHPIIPITGQETPPIGYYLPNDAWTCQFSGIRDSTFRLSLFTDSAVLVYWRSGVDSTQNEEVHYAGNDSSLLILNPDPESRPYNVDIVCSAADSEIYYTINDIPIDHNDSTRFSIKPASKLQLDNYGATKTYDLRIEIAGTNVDTVFFREGITLDSNCSYLIVPDWRPCNDSLMILVDSGMVGSFSDTVFVRNKGEYIRGDANKDRVINSADAAYLINYLFIGGPAPDPSWLGDANCDGKINSADVTYLINYLFVGGPPPGC